MSTPNLRRLRRSTFFGLTLLTSTAASWLMYDILSANGFTPAERAGLALFWVLFTWISGAFWTSVAGFVVRLRGGDPATLGGVSRPQAPLRSRTAILMPIYNEDTARVSAGLEAVWRSLAREPEEHAFDLFILSDTRRPEIAAAEEAAFRLLIERLGAAGRIYYRRRRENLGRKAGNIADFVRSWGAAYECAVVLDADSVMSGPTLVQLARLMDAHPQAGIIQALPMPAGRETLFARCVQFAARLSSPMLASGLTWWQLGEGNYWGHNAILRLKPFAEYCALPTLPGPAPLGGEILSHDFVEAAFMRRAGYEVWLVPELGGSWEEVPSNIIDYAARDRRWAQGNLQHLGLLPARGLHWLSRVHLLTGVLSYATSPIWLAVLVLSSVVVCLDAVAGEQYFAPGSYTLFPTWPEYRDPQIAVLLGMTVVVLFLPKLLAAALALLDAEQRRAFGGGGRLLMSVLVEQVFSVLLAPAMMMFHSAFVLSTLAGKPVVWHAQERGDRGIGLPEAFVRHGTHVLLGIGWGVALYFIAPRYVAWMAPVLAGLVLSVPLTMWSSRSGAGRGLRRLGLLLTPEETAPPVELAAVAEAMRTERWAAATVKEALALEEARAQVQDLPLATGTGPHVAIRRGPVAPLPELPQRAPLRMQAEALRYVGSRVPPARTAVKRLQSLVERRAD